MDEDEEKPEVSKPKFNKKNNIEFPSFKGAIKYKNKDKKYVYKEMSNTG